MNSSAGGLTPYFYYYSFLRATTLLGLGAHGESGGKPAAIDRHAVALAEALGLMTAALGSADLDERLAHTTALRRPESIDAGELTLLDADRCRAMHRVRQA